MQPKLEVLEHGEEFLPREILPPWALMADTVTRQTQTAQKNVFLTLVEVRPAVEAHDRTWIAEASRENEEEDNCDKQRHDTFDL